MSRVCISGDNMSRVCISGDNMLTALSVARDCGMIERKDKVILAMVTPPIGTQPPGVGWTYAEDTKRNVTEIQTIRQVDILNVAFG